MQIIVSTDGRAKPAYSDPSGAPDIDVPQVEDIRYGRTMGGRDDHSYAYIELTADQAIALIARLTAVLAHARRDEALTEALGIAPGETLRIDV